MKNIALQMYSLHQLTPVDFLGTLKSVAEIGYKAVEFAGYFNTPANVLKRTLKDLELVPAASHIWYKDLKDNPEKVIEYSLEIGNHKIICTHFPEELHISSDSWKRKAEIINSISEKCKRSGIECGYQNHGFEFKQFEGKYALDILMENTQPDLMFLELETFFVEYCGLSSTELINKYKPRCKMLHLKDMKLKGEMLNTEIGSGLINFKDIVAAGNENNAEYYIVKQENYEIPPLDSIAQSLKYVQSLLAKG